MCKGLWGNPDLSMMWHLSCKFCNLDVESSRKQVSLDGCGRPTCTLYSLLFCYRVMWVWCGGIDATQGFRITLGSLWFHSLSFRLFPRSNGRYVFLSTCCYQHLTWSWWSCLLFTYQVRETLLISSRGSRTGPPVPGRGECGGDWRQVCALIVLSCPW